MQNLRGILLMIFSMAAFAIEDACMKFLSRDLPVSQLLVMLGIGGATAFAVLTYVQRGSLAPLVHRDMKSPIMLWRNACEGLSAIFFVTALSLVPLSTVAAVFQALPLAITAGAALFLGDQVGWRRWSAIILGFVGVLIVIRPGSDSFQLAALLPIAAVLGTALRDLLTRRLNPQIPSLSVAFYGFLAVVPAGLALSLINTPFVAPTSANWALIPLTVFVGVTGYYAIVQAMRIAETAIVMPFRYMRLIFSLILGVLVFREHPDLWTFVGAGLILTSGLYMFLRERRIAKTSRP